MTRIKNNDLFFGSSAKSYREGHKDILQDKYNSEFEFATDTLDGEIESVIGTKIFAPITVRAQRVMIPEKAAYLGDDYLKLYFKDLDQEIQLGTKFKFKGFTWITFNTETVTSLTKTCVVRRCNESLKWYDRYGVLKEEPVIVDYFKFTYTYNNVDFDKNMRLGGNQRFVVFQRNADTNALRRDLRFMFNDMAWRIASVEKTTHYGLIETSMEEHQIDEATDDLINCIADAFYTERYSIVPNTKSIELAIDESFELEYAVYTDGKIAAESVQVISGDDSIISIDNNIVTGLAAGHTTIELRLIANPLVKTVIDVTVDAVAEAFISGVDTTRFGGTYNYQIENAGSDLYTFGCDDSSVKVVNISNNVCNVTVPAVVKTIVLYAISGEKYVSKSIVVRSVWG